MLKRVSMFAATVAAVMVPAISQAATVALSYTTLQYSATQNGTYTAVTLSGNAVTGFTATLPAAGFFRFNVGVNVTGNANIAAASAPGNDGNDNLTPQPANLGIGGYGATITTSNLGVAKPVQSAAATATVEAVPLVTFPSNIYSSSTSGGINATSGTIGDADLTQIQGGINAAGLSASDSSNFPKYTLGANGVASAFSRVTYQALAGGTSQLAATFSRNTVALVSVRTIGDANTAPTYQTSNLAATDVLTQPGTLTITVTGAGTPEPATLGLVGTAAIGVLARRRRA